MKPVFLDTGYLIALEASDDQNHAAARRHWRGFSRRLPPLVTTSLVFAFDRHFIQAGFQKLP